MSKYIKLGLKESYKENFYYKKQDGCHPVFCVLLIYFISLNTIAVRAGR